MSSAPEAFVEFIGLEKSYDGESLVVQNLDLKIRRGEFLTLLGPSGSGKTTTLMMLAGFEVPTAGRIFLDGASIEQTPPNKRDIGVVFQNYALFPHMTVAENLAFPLEVRGVPKAEIGPKVERALEMVQLGGYSKRRPTQLSGGQQQRVALARAFVFEPKLMLMDEPLGALDKQLREHMQLEIRHLHERLGVTVVYVTHDQSEAMTMSDRIAVFNNGRIQQLGSAVDLYEHPSNAFVARFIGENNRLLGTIASVDGEWCKATLDDGLTVIAKAVNVGPVGTATTLSIRPERAVIAAPGAAMGENQFKATVQELIYLGDHTRVRMAFGNHEDFIVKVPAGHADTALAPGAEVVVGWQRQDCRALDAS